jgi:hypothetical protein
MDEDENSMEDETDNVENGFQQVYGWFVVVNRLAGNDFTKHEQIYQAGLNEILNQLSYLIAYDREQERLQKKAMSRH